MSDTGFIFNHRQRLVTTKDEKQEGEVDDRRIVSNIHNRTVSFIVL